MRLDRGGRRRVDRAAGRAESGSYSGEEESRTGTSGEEVPVPRRCLNQNPRPFIAVSSLCLTSNHCAGGDWR